MTYYIDRKTGKQVSEIKWKRSKAQDGKRYVRRRSKKKPPTVPPPPKRGEWTIRLDYGSRKQGNLLQTETHITGPESATPAEVLSAFQAWQKDKHAPEGWQVTQIKYGPKLSKDADEAVQQVMRYGKPETPDRTR